MTADSAVPFIGNLFTRNLAAVGCGLHLMEVLNEEGAYNTFDAVAIARGLDRELSLQPTYLSQEMNPHLSPSCRYPYKLHHSSNPFGLSWTCLVG